jgi:hypothetical protein
MCACDQPETPVKKVGTRSHTQNEAIQSNTGQVCNCHIRPAKYYLKQEVKENKMYNSLTLAEAAIGPNVFQLAHCSMVKREKRRRM